MLVFLEGRICELALRCDIPAFQVLMHTGILLKISCANVCS